MLCPDVHACIVVLSKPPELQKWFVKSTHTGAVFFPLNSNTFAYLGHITQANC